MNPLINDLNLLYEYARSYCAGAHVSFAYERLLKFIKYNTPWYPPQQEGYGPWIEYRKGGPEPRVEDIVHVLTPYERAQRDFDASQAAPAYEYWPITCVVAYCVKNKET